MAKKRKLQVFISSTFTDLKEERQAAVEAILTTGHIPAGMELFTGENEEQMNIINRWIEESDIYMLLLGGRYGSVDSVSGKSYTHLEFEYAQHIGKPIFVVVASEAYNKEKLKNANEPGDVVELNNPTEYKKFRDDIVSRYAKFWSNQDQLKLAIINTIHSLEQNEDLVGWIPGSEATDTGPIAEQLARLLKENEDLRNQISKVSSNNTLYNGLTFEQMYKLISDIIPLTEMSEEHSKLIRMTAESFGDPEPTAVHVFFLLGINSTAERVVDIEEDIYFLSIVNKLVEYGIVYKGKGHRLGEGRSSRVAPTYGLTPDGIKFMLRLKVEKDEAKFHRILREQFENF